MMSDYDMSENMDNFWEEGDKRSLEQIALGEGVLVSPNIIFDFPEKDVVDAKGEEPTEFKYEMDAKGDPKECNKAAVTSLASAAFVLDQEIEMLQKVDGDESEDEFEEHIFDEYKIEYGLNNGGKDATTVAALGNHENDDAKNVLVSALKVGFMPSGMSSTQIKKYPNVAAAMKKPAVPSLQRTSNEKKTKVNNPSKRGKKRKKETTPSSSSLIKKKKNKKPKKKKSRQNHHMASLKHLQQK